MYYVDVAGNFVLCMVIVEPVGTYYYNPDHNCYFVSVCSRAVEQGKPVGSITMFDPLKSSTPSQGEPQISHVTSVHSIYILEHGLLLRWNASHVQLAINIC